jgi:hypothetical protein
MQIKLVERPRLPRQGISKALTAPTLYPPGKSGWSGSRPIALDRGAARLMEVEALRLAARAGQARIAADYAAEAGRRRTLQRAAEAFEARARSFEALLAEA